MDQHSTDSKLPNMQTTRQISATPTKYSETVGTASMFENAKNPIIMGGTFNNTLNTNNFNKGDGLDALHKRVAPNAILNAGGRADEVRCHPGTREEVISQIEKWRDVKDDQTPPILWLSGPAGAGKSAIMQTIAEGCDGRGEPQANFFFFRGDSSRSSAAPLVATLLHQIILLYPSLGDRVAAVLVANPLIFDSVLEKQLVQLLVMPLRAVQQLDSSFRPPLLLIDGLDECDSENKNIQRQILRAFDNVIAKYDCPFRLLVASRDESQIRMAFNERSSPLLLLYLDDQFFPERDILIYVTDQFEHIRKTHPLAHTLDATWPSASDIEGIVEKSSGQFIYAATVIRFISDSSASPVLSLQRVQGAAKISTKSPFAYLDAIYTYILSQVEDQEALKDILRSQLLINNSRSDPELSVLLQIQEYTEELVRSCLADLTPIARYTPDNRLLFYHASFSDYLLDKSRSGDYFVDIEAFHIKILPAVWKCVGTVPEATQFASDGLARLKALPPGFLNTISVLEPSNLKLGFGDNCGHVFERIHSLCTCDDDITNYKRIIHGWIKILEDSVILDGSRGAEYPPRSRRYFMMVHVERNLAMAPSADVATALRPDTKFDTRETTLWLNTLLHRIHREYYTNNIRNYQELLKQWISWAVQNYIPLDDLHNLPGARWYFWKRRIERWAARHLKLGNGKD